MTKHEAKFLSNEFGPWLKVNGHRIPVSCPFEAKSSRGGKTIPFSYFLEHQTNSLLACTTEKGYWYKISDESSGYKPFDGVFYKNAPAYYVLSYPRKNFYIVSIHQVVNEFKRQGSKGSISEQRAKEISIMSNK